MAENDSAKHKHGNMDIHEQEKTFAGFTRFAVWTVVIVAVILVFLALINA